MPIPGLGELLLRDSIITREQLDEALAVQASRYENRNLLGIILINSGYISKETFIRYLEIQTNMLAESSGEGSVPKIGELLLADGVITKAQLGSAMKKQDRRGGEPLGMILLRLKAISQDTLIQYLLKQTEMAVDAGRVSE